MAYTLTELLQDVITDLGLATVGVATSGTASRITDTKLKGKNSAYTDWWVMVIQTVDAGAPQGQYSNVLSFDDTTGAINVNPAFTTVVDQDDLYMLIPSLLPMYQSISLANLALRKLGQIPQVNTSLVSDSVTTEFTTSFLDKAPLDVLVQETGDTEWKPEDRWDFLPGKLIFYEAPATGTIKVVYTDYHAKLSLPTDQISVYVPKPLALAAAKLEFLDWLVGKGQGGDPFLLQQRNESAVALNAARLRTPIWVSARQSKLTRF